MIIHHNYRREAGGESRVMGAQESSVLFFATYCDCIITSKQNPSRVFFVVGGGGERVDRGAWLATVQQGHKESDTTKVT